GIEIFTEFLDVVVFHHGVIQIDQPRPNDRIAWVVPQKIDARGAGQNDVIALRVWFDKLPPLCSTRIGYQSRIKSEHSNRNHRPKKKTGLSRVRLRPVSLSVWVSR